MIILKVYFFSRWCPTSLTIFDIICESSGIEFSVFGVSSGGVKVSLLTALDVTEI